MHEEPLREGLLYYRVLLIRASLGGKILYGEHKSRYRRDGCSKSSSTSAARVSPQIITWDDFQFTTVRLCGHLATVATPPSQIFHQSKGSSRGREGTRELCENFVPGRKKGEVSLGGRKHGLSGVPCLFKQTEGRWVKKAVKFYGSEDMSIHKHNRVRDEYINIYFGNLYATAP